MASLTAQREQTAALDDAHIDLLTTTAYSVANVRAMEQPLLAKGVPLMRMAYGSACLSARETTVQMACSPVPCLRHRA